MNKKRYHEILQKNKRNLILNFDNYQKLENPGGRPQKILEAKYR